MKSFKLTKSGNEAAKSESHPLSMKLYEKILIFIEIILTAFYTLIILPKGQDIGTSIGSLIGVYIILFIPPLLVAKIASLFYKSEARKSALWKIFIKIYPVLLILAIIGKISA